jgi:hypothetical protein
LRIDGDESLLQKLLDESSHEIITSASSALSPTDLSQISSIVSTP